ncbi:Uncharacterised protein [Chlamydia trachomatis]|nr:Uncharacterised protein [Chlamydia trachomatis]
MYGKPSQPCTMTRAIFVKVGSVFQGTIPKSRNGKIFSINGRTCTFIAPIESLKKLPKLMMEMKAGTAHGSKKITPNTRLNLINGWFAMIAVATPMMICRVDAQSVQMNVQERTEPNAVRKVLNCTMLRKFLTPTQSKSFCGGTWRKS